MHFLFLITYLRYLFIFVFAFLYLGILENILVFAEHCQDSQNTAPVSVVYTGEYLQA